MTIVYAHRGASARFPEHTRAAYDQALVDGADGVECDVHLTADGEVVLIHDGTVDRTSDGSGPVAEHTLEQLRDLDIWSWRGVALPAGALLADQLLTLDDLLDLLLAAGRPVGLACELKHEALGEGPALEDAVLAVLEKRGWDPETGRVGTVDVSFMSFDPDSVGHLLQRGVPGRLLCQLVAAGFALGTERLDDGSVGIAGPGLDYLAAYPDRVRTWLAAGATARVWTVDTEDDLRRCLDLGVGEVTTNDPAGIRALL
ncbi:glycerophosphodiester phosphodiesterase [Pseudonocardia sp. CA-107938]|uniref:glycerophosphodiester phosphodiesterase n=1 Tax=Pseudonocardia sp. CA-107938 TaxID=3240021 RepID=UPI003D907530